MKRIQVLFLAAALCARLPAVYAQDLSEPNEQSVLQKARDKYARGGESAVPAENPDSPVAAPSAAASELPYTPYVFALVPGLQSPPGLYDTSLALGLIGSAAGGVRGIQGSGVFNFATGDVNGFQGAGVFNMAGGTVFGFQGAGVFNLARGVNGFQGAGVFNIAGQVDGFQGSGVFNIAQRVDGFQISGTFNLAGSVDGGMLSPMFNAAKRVDGVMIGLVNVAESLDGVAIGLLNLIGDGVNELGVQYVPAEDMTYVSYRSGTADLYTVYYGGLGSEDWFVDGDSLIAGLGLGHRVRLGEGGLDFEIGAEQELYPARRAAMKAAVKADDEDGFYSLLCPYPAVRVSLFARVLGFKVFLGLETDFDVPAWGSAVPDRLRVSSFDADGWSGRALGLDFTAWPKIYFGVSF